MPRTSAARAASTTGGTGASIDVESIGSCPPMTAWSRAASRTVRPHGPGLVERAGERDEAVARDAAVGRLGADRAGDGRGLADRAAGVGADRERRLERGEHRARAAARAAGDPVEVPRVVRRAVGRVLGRGAHRELVHVGLAEDRQAGLAQLRHDRRVVRRDPALEDPAAARRRQALGRHDVLDGDRHAGEGAEALARLTPLVDRARLGEGALGVDVEVGVHLAVDGGDPVEVRLGHLDGADGLAREGVGQVGGGGPRQVGWQVGHVSAFGS